MFKPDEFAGLDAFVLADPLAGFDTFDEVFDEGVTKGFVNWQLFGSRKPGNKAYDLTYYFTMVYDKEDDTWELKENNVSKLNILEHLPIMCARNSNHKKFDLLDNKYLLEAIDEEKNDLLTKEYKKPKINIVQKIDFEQYDLSKITDIKELNTLFEIIISASPNNFFIFLLSLSVNIL